MALEPAKDAVPLATAAWGNMERLWLYNLKTRGEKGRK